MKKLLFSMLMLCGMVSGLQGVIFKIAVPDRNINATWKIADAGQFGGINKLKQRLAEAFMPMLDQNTVKFFKDKDHEEEMTDLELMRNWVFDGNNKIYVTAGGQAQSRFFVAASNESFVSPGGGAAGAEVSSGAAAARRGRARRRARADHSSSSSNADFYSDSVSSSSSSSSDSDSDSDSHSDSDETFQLTVNVIDPAFSEIPSISIKATPDSTVGKVRDAVAAKYNDIISRDGFTIKHRGQSLSEDGKTLRSYKIDALNTPTIAVYPKSGHSFRKYDSGGGAAAAVTVAALTAAVKSIMSIRSYRRMKNKLVRKYGLGNLTDLQDKVWMATFVAHRMPYFLHRLVRNNPGKDLTDFTGKDPLALAHFYYGHKPSQAEYDDFIELFFNSVSQ